MTFTRNKNFLIPLLLLPVWFLLYFNLKGITDILIDSVFSLQSGAHLTESLRFFVFEVPKVLLLLSLGRQIIVYGKCDGFGLGRSYAFLLVFCHSFVFGFCRKWCAFGCYFLVSDSGSYDKRSSYCIAFWYVWLESAIFSGWIIGKLKLEKWVADWVYKTRFGQNQMVDEKMDFSQRINMGFTAVKDIVGKVWIYIMIGVGIGAGMHGYVPEDFMVSVMDKSNWFSVPLSVLIGVPLYSNAAGIIPIVSVLIEKGVPLGTALAFMMSTIGLSLPEIIILKKVLKMPLILTFVGIVASGILIVGFIFNWIF